MIIRIPQLLRCDVCGADIGPTGKPGRQQVFADDFLRPARVTTCLDFRCLDLARQYARPCFPEQ